MLIVGTKLQPRYPDTLIYMHIKEKDCPSANLYQHFEPAIDFINKATNDGGRVLVHCHEGVSRSATIVISYLIKQG